LVLHTGNAGWSHEDRRACTFVRYSQPCTKVFARTLPILHRVPISQAAHATALYVQVFDKNQSVLVDDVSGQLVLEIVALVENFSPLSLSHAQSLGHPLRARTINLMVRHCIRPSTAALVVAPPGQEKANGCSADDSPAGSGIWGALRDRRANFRAVGRKETPDAGLITSGFPLKNENG